MDSKRVAKSVGAQEEVRRGVATVVREGGREGGRSQGRQPLSAVKAVVAGKTIPLLPTMTGGKGSKAGAAELRVKLQDSVTRAVSQRADRPLEVIASLLLHGPPTPAAEEAAKTTDGYVKHHGLEAHLQRQLAKAGAADSGGLAHVLGGLLLKAEARERSAAWKELGRAELALELKALKIEQAVREREIKELQGEIQSRPIPRKCNPGDHPEESEIQKKYDEIAVLRVDIQKRKSLTHPKKGGPQQQGSLARIASSPL